MHDIRVCLALDDFTMAGLLCLAHLPSFYLTITAVLMALSVLFFTG
jgi:hypothetical protein